MIDMRRHLAMPLVALLAAAGLTACGGSEDHNAADIAFAQGMIPHHQQALEMADLVTAEASVDVRDVATQIKTAQQPEIETLEGWLDEWDAEDDMGGMDHGDDHGQDGMVSESSMASLQKLSGAEFERRWLELMIKHHEGAIDAAVIEVRDGRNGEAVHLANEIVDAQQAEIDTMKGLTP